MAQLNKRDALKGAYPSKKWHRRVDGMSEKQVTAVYLRLKQQNVL